MNPLTLKDIRPSLLPKLWECPKYRPKPGPAGPAAERGTRMDEAFRFAVMGDRSKLEALPPEDGANVQWAIDLVERYKCNGTLEAREEYLAMPVPGLPHVGTADILCDRTGWVGDLKTGQMRNYFPQMAAYALSCMVRTFEQVWATHVIYCDQQKVLSYNWTLEQAQKTIDTIKAAALDPNSQPQASEYCTWCANYATCPAVVRPIEEGLAVIDVPKTSVPEILERVMATPETLAQFASQWKAVEKAVAEPALDELRRLLDEGGEVDGWKLTEVNGREYFDVEAILFVARETNAPVESIILAMGGKMSGKSYREWAAALGREPLPSHIRTGSPSKQLRQVKPKQPKLKN